MAPYALRLERILDAIARLPPGPTRSEIQAEAGMQDLDIQILRRVLARLIQAGRLRAEGQTRNRRYFRVAGEATQAAPRAQDGEAYPPLSPEGEASRRMLAQPLSMRQPVSYQRAFLDAYRPNESFYLPASVRDHLAAYERSCARYSAVLASLGEPDPFRLRYRADIKAIVREVILAGVAPAEAEPRIRAYAEARLPGEAWLRFLTVVETELASIHDGNFARYQLRPSAFAAWKHR